MGEVMAVRMRKVTRITARMWFGLFWMSILHS